MIGNPQSEPILPEVAGLIVFVVVIYSVWCVVAPLIAKLSAVMP